MEIGFIGLGTMGAGMALNLLKAGHDVFVYDVRPENMERLVAAGAKKTTAIDKIAQSVDAVFTSLPGPKEMQEVALGNEGLVASLKPGSVWFDLTTNSPKVVQDIAALCSEKRVSLLDVPVSGVPGSASAGKLTIFVGGDREVFVENKHLLDAIGDRVIYVGGVGAGNTTKIVHNLVSLVLRMTLAEGISLGVKAGLDPVDLWNAVREGYLGRTSIMDVGGEYYLQSTYEPPNFSLRLAFKDLTLAVELARQHDVPMKTLDIAYADYTTAMERGWGERDSRSPMMLQNERAGVSLKVSDTDIKKLRRQPK